jgi:hypothetical protein
MVFFLSLAAFGEIDPPSGGVSPLAWILITALVGALGTVSVVSLNWIKKLYDDLKECNGKRASQEEDVLGLLRVLRLQMEQSKGGRPR